MHGVKEGWGVNWELFSKKCFLDVLQVSINNLNFFSNFLGGKFF